MPATLFLSCQGPPGTAGASLHWGPRRPVQASPGRSPEPQTPAAGEGWPEADRAEGQQGRAGWRTASPAQGGRVRPVRPPEADASEQVGQEFNTYMKTP